MKFNLGLMLKKLNGQFSKIQSKLKFLDMSSSKETLETLIAKGLSSNKLDAESISTIHAWKDFSDTNMDTEVKEAFSKEQLKKISDFTDWLIFERKINSKEAFIKLGHLVDWLQFALTIPVKEIPQTDNQESNQTANISVAETPHVVLKIDTNNGSTTMRGVSKKRKKKVSDKDFIIEDVEPTEVHVPEHEYDPNETPMQEGRTAYAPISINSAYSRGYLYYPVQTVLCEREVDKQGKEKLIEHIEVVCIRSDKSIQRVSKSDLPDGANAHQRIYRLTDGTLISSLPKPSDYATWSWSSISEFINNESTIDPLDQMLYVMHGHLKSRVWLPTEADYWLLSLIAAASYCQTIFDAVPLVLLNGPAGSGKSEISAAMVEISANSVMLGTVSASTMIRAIDAASGLCVLDDLEAIGVGRNSNKKGNFSEIAQMIKVSYKKDSATKMITNTSTGRQEILNFYGIKIISATLVPDSILASRMLYVHTKHMTDDDMEEFKARERFDEDLIACLVDKMHTWVFSNVGVIRSKYEELFASKSNRDDEISAPLKVLAELSGDSTIIKNLEIALSNQSRRKNKELSPEEVLEDIVESLIVEGYHTVSIFHLMMELRKELDPGYSINYAKDNPGWSKPEWIGRILRGQGYVKDGDIRKRLHGSNLRAVTFKSSFVSKVLAKKEKEKSKDKSLFAFCTDCSGCPYKMLSCEIKAKKGVKAA